MNRETSLKRVLTSAVFVVTPLTIIGCSQQGSVVSLRQLPQIQSAAVSSACANGILSFASAGKDHAVNVYSNMRKCGTVSFHYEPSGIAVDANDNLWVVTGSHIEELKPPYYGKPATILKDPGLYAYNVAVCKDYVAVTNSNYHSSISIFRDGATRPTSILTEPKAQLEIGVACDPSGNLYSTYWPSGGPGAVNEWIGGKGKPKELSAMSQGDLQGIEWSGSALWIEEQDTSTLSEWKPPFTKAARSITLKGAEYLEGFAFSPFGSVIFAGGCAGAGYYDLSGKPIQSMPGLCTGSQAYSQP